MKNISILLISMALTLSCSAPKESAVDKIVKNYETLVPLDFGTMILTRVVKTDKIFGYVYEYPSKKDEWSNEMIISAKALGSMTMDTQINTFNEFVIIRESGRDVVFSYFDSEGVGIYSIYYEQVNGVFKYNDDLSTKLDKKF